jgi:hypothetical protein
VPPDAAVRVLVSQPLLAGHVEDVPSVAVTIDGMSL